MKLVPLLLVLLLAGCGHPLVQPEPVYPSAAPFEAVVYLEQEDREGRGILRRETGGLFLTLEEPREVDGLAFAQEPGEGLVLSLGELSVQLPPDSLPVSAPFRLLKECLEQASLLPLEEQEDGSWAAQGTCSGGAFRLWVDRESGKFLRLEVSQESFLVTFENLRFSLEGEGRP